MSLEQEKYMIVKELLSKEVCKITELYCLFEMLNNFNPDKPTGQVPGTHFKYGDNMTETLLLHAKPKLESVTGLKLVPTYSYHRVYKPGDILPDHQDRPSCEISATVTIGFKYNDKDDNYHWNLHGYVNGEKCYLQCGIGDAVIYKGCELVHGRDRFEVGEYSYQVQVFLHYVDANGPYSDSYKYDGRPAIGVKNALI
jgi:hypothetical protein